MREFDFKIFYNNLQEDILEAKSYVSEIEDCKWQRMHTDNKETYYSEEDEINEIRLKDILNQIKLKLDFAYEYIGLEKMGENLKCELEKYQGKIEKLEFIPFVDVLFSPVLWIFEKHLGALTSHVIVKEDSDFENKNAKMLLEQILRGTPKMIKDRNIKPANEKEVRNEVYKMLIHVFPDTVKEIPISKVSKIYKPDIGVKSIKSAIEYKFIDSAKEAKTAIGGIFEDIQGYEGSADWTTFYAVIYMTDSFITQDQVEAEFRLSKAPHNWKPIVVFGKGERKRKMVHNIAIPGKSGVSAS